MDEEKNENATRFTAAPNGEKRSASMPVTRSATTSRIVRDRPTAKVLSADEEMLSEKVRAFYDAGTDEQLQTESSTNLAARMGARWQTTLAADNQSASVPSLSRATSTTDINQSLNSSRQPSMTASASQTHMVSDREENELAGGLEDWKDIDNADVDRYGFIVARAPTGPVDGANDSRPQRLTRMSTSLQLASETPRRKVTIRRTPSSAHGSPRSGQSRYSGADQTPPRPTSSQSGYARTPTSRRTVSTRILGKDRRLMDSAMDMLTLPRSARSVVEDGHVHIDDARARRKELEREEKWRKMAREKPPATDPKTRLPVVGGGSDTGYTFDTSSPKLIERTWKGIPDKWRATAWHSFLSTSASRRKDCLSDAQLVELFHSYQSESSPDDVQIDIDVPRTISAHIMFRRRYRGGQRLLFRVLHAMSLHCPDTGYVQGMAALAVTLLAYYDEEKAFVMLVRMWELRGLGELYKAGFGGLMTALSDFEGSWLGQGEVARKLEELNIGPTAYGTRWYLTLFNYTIPFPAQLRVWDVFMLLGDDSTPKQRPASRATGQPESQSEAEPQPEFGTTLDILHASSAALIDGMRDILLESDFENAMKVLTSWIPIQDEDLFMRIAKAEFKMHLKHDGSKGGGKAGRGG
ncbi:rab-GTPase-TBC domain-containing protein [Exophiala viscosa]|uniref:Rab-GTPase-TBC domain-containing protein n=1 Tax=Exophiala viscosa TaxID=2486360 RepID=A0AAN6E602_9EURO|nr:rab-GTPase-TBC domain-containing protein [Exophiala viscosa]